MVIIRPIQFQRHKHAQAFQLHARTILSDIHLYHQSAGNRVGLALEIPPVEAVDRFSTWIKKNAFCWSR
jgi:hypothetical protein